MVSVCPGRASSKRRTHRVAVAGPEWCCKSAQALEAATVISRSADSIDSWEHSSAEMARECAKRARRATTHVTGPATPDRSAGSRIITLSSSFLVASIFQISVHPDGQGSGPGLGASCRHWLASCGPRRASQRLRTSSSGFRSQTWAVLSLLAVTSVRPSGL